MYYYTTCFITFLMIRKQLPMFFMAAVVMSIGMSGITHANLDSTAIISGSLIDDTSYSESITESSTTFDVIISLSSDVVNSNLAVGGVVTITGVDTNGNTAIATANITNTAGNQLGYNDFTITGTVNLSGLDYSDGDSLTIEIEPTRDGGVTTLDVSVGGGVLSDIIVVTDDSICEYENLPGINYGEQARDVTSDAQIWGPSISNSTAYTQPHTVNFDVDHFRTDSGNNILSNYRTSINGTAPTSSDSVVTITGVDASTVFEFITTFQFGSSNTYVNNIGNTLSQTIELSYLCVVTP